MIRWSIKDWWFLWNTLHIHTLSVITTITAISMATNVNHCRIYRSWAVHGAIAFDVRAYRHGAQHSYKEAWFLKNRKMENRKFRLADCSSIVNRPNEGTKLGRITQETLLDAAVPLDKAKYGCKILAKTSLPLTGKFVPSRRETGKLLPMDIWYSDKRKDVDCEFFLIKSCDTAQV